MTAYCSMKRSLRIFASVAAVVAMLTSCQKEQTKLDTNSSPVVALGIFTVKADNVEPANDSGTKTAFVDSDSPYVKWLESDKINVWEFVDGVENACFSTAQNGTHLSDGGKTATFDISLNGTDPGGSEYRYTAVYPEDAVTGNSGTYSFEIPANQTLTDGNFAVNADILIGKSIKIGNRISATSCLQIQFKRPGTVVKLTLKGISAGEKISVVKITAPSEQMIAGRCKINLSTGEISDKASQNGTNEITLDCGDAVATGEDVLCFRCLDGTWERGSSVSIKVETNVATYSKTVILPKDYVFADGGLTKFGFQGMTRNATIPGNTLPGVFTVADKGNGNVKKVHFSKGNLWVDGSKALHFEDAQWKSTPSSNGSMDNGHISHFTWSHTISNAISSDSSYSGSYLFCDENHKQSVDGSGSIYYALSSAEWAYLFNSGYYTNSIRKNLYAYGVKVMGKVNCVILYPDGFTGTKVSNGDTTSYDEESEWSAAQAAGVVCLPTAGFRIATSISNVDVHGYYWTSSLCDSLGSWFADFLSNTVYPGTGYVYRSYGCSIRLVTEAE